MPNRAKIFETVDIEALIARAFREKDVHRLWNVTAALLGLSGPKAPGGVSTNDKVDTSSFSDRAATCEMQAQLAAAPDILLDLHDAVLGLPDFCIERDAGFDFAVWDEETVAGCGHRIEVDLANGVQIIKIERRGGHGPGRDNSLPAGEPRRLTALVTSTIVLFNGQHSDRHYAPDVIIGRMRPVYSGRDKLAVGYVPVHAMGVQGMVEVRATSASIAKEI